LINAYMICDFNNPISMRYVELSLKSLEPLKDLINVTPVQCTTPETLPIRFEKNQKPIPFYVQQELGDYVRQRHYGGTFCDDMIYNCIMHSHMKYIERIAQGEEIIILEHDAALINEESFREMFDTFWGADTFFPGACMEFYGLSQRFAKWMVELMQDFPYVEEQNGYPVDQRYSGPMGIIAHSRDLGFGNGTYLAPTKEKFELDKVCFSKGIQSCFMANGTLFEPAFKQYYFTKSKNTNSPDYSDLLEDETVQVSDSGPMRRDFVFIDA
jgi:hypothetical protein